MSQIVLVTGASSGIGAATAQLLHMRDFTVFGTTRTPNPPQQNEIHMLTLDVNSEDSVRNCVAEVISQGGRIDILVNNAGYALVGPAEESARWRG